MPLLLAGGLLAACASTPPAPEPPPPTRPVPDSTLTEDVPRTEKTMLEALWDAEKELRAQRKRIAELEAEVARLRERLAEAPAGPGR